MLLGRDQRERVGLVDDLLVVVQGDVEQMIGLETSDDMNSELTYTESCVF